MLKNVSGQKIGAQMITAADGTPFTGSVTVAVTGDAGTQATGSVGSGACAHEGGGYHTYAPAQAETNYDLVAFTFSGTGAISATVQVYTLPTTGILAPTTAGRTLDVSAAGNAGVDWANVENPTTTLNLSGTTVKTATDVATAVAALNNISTSDIDNRLVAIGLDHLFSAPCTSSDVTDSSFAAKITSKSATPSFASYVNTTDSHEALRDHAATVPALVWTSDISSVSTSGQAGTYLNNIVNRIGAFVGTGANTILGWLRAIMRSDISTPDDIGGSYGAAAHSLMANAAYGASASSSASTINTNLDALIVTVGVAGAGLTAADDAVITAIGALSIPTANQNAAALLDLAAGVETGLTVRQAMRLLAAAAAGELSGAATTTIVIRNAVADSKDRITATVDADGNRSAITVDLS